MNCLFWRDMGFWEDFWELKDFTFWFPFGRLNGTAFLNRSILTRSCKAALYFTEGSYLELPLSFWPGKSIIYLFARFWKILLFLFPLPMASVGWDAIWQAVATEDPMTVWERWYFRKNLLPRQGFRFFQYSWWRCVVCLPFPSPCFW